MSKIHKIFVKNMKSVVNESLELNGCSVIVTGGNNKGKTTLLCGLIDRIRGEKPELIVRQGERDGQAEIELTTGEVFRWSFNDKGKETLVFITKEGFKMSVTRDIVNNFFPQLFNIDEFLLARPQKQSDMLQKLVGLDFRELDEEYKNAYEERAYHNKRLKEVQAKLAPINPNLPSEIIDYSDKIVELKTLDEHNKRYNEFVKRLQDKSDNIVKSKQKIDSLLSEISLIKSEILANEDLIDKGNKWLNDEKNKPKNEEQKKHLEIEINEIKAKNLAITENNKNKVANRDFCIIEEARNTAEDRVSRAKQKKADAIKNSDLPDGFEITDDGIIVDGLPLQRGQVSQSKLYISALKLAALQIQRVRTLYFDASPLDKNSLREIQEWAMENELQLLIERPDFDGGNIEYHIIEE